MIMKTEILLCIIGVGVVFLVGGYIFFSLTTEMEVYQEKYGEFPELLNPLTGIRFAPVLLVIAIVMIIYVKWWFGFSSPGK